MRRNLPTPCPLFIQMQDLGNRKTIGTQQLDPGPEVGLTPIFRDFLGLLRAASKQFKPSINCLLLVSSLDNHSGCLLMVSSLDNHLGNALPTQCLTADEALTLQACDSVTNRC